MMACKIIYENGKPIGIACGSPWGIGVYIYDEETGESLYGFPPDGLNPELFHPDAECCSPQEIAAHQEALAVWRAR
jgi:hypothetical protein